MVKLSASKVKTLFNCGILFWLAYKRPEDPLPRGSNDGANRGSVTHYVLECLLRKDRHPRVDAILENRDPWSDAAVERLARHHAVKLDVAGEENFEMIRGFILTALENDFYHPGAEELVAEYQFDIKTDKYHIGGFIDKTAVYSKGVTVVDYKTSKKKFAGKEVTFNLQNYFYTLAVRVRYPEKPITLEFQFLKFPKSPVQAAPGISDDEMEGFEEWLAEVSKFIDEMTYEQAKAMGAKYGGFDRKWLCGGNFGELKADGTPKWHCDQKFPYIYFTLVENGKVLRAEKNRSVLEKVMKEDQEIVQRHYPGCPLHVNLWKGKK